MHTNDCVIEKFEKLSQAFKNERVLAKYFYGLKEPFMVMPKDTDHLTRMNKFKWESEEERYISKIEEIPTSKLENAETEEKYLYYVKGFKARYKKLLNKLAARMDLAHWHSFLKVGRFDVLARCINPVISFPEQNKEIILRRNVFKTLYKYSSLAINRNLLVKDLSSPNEQESKLLFLKPVWMTPNVCVIFMGFYNIEAIERHEYVAQVESCFKEAMKSKNLTYIVYSNRISSLLVSLPIDEINKRKRIEKQGKRYRKLSSITKKSAQKMKKHESADPTEQKLPAYLYSGNVSSIFSFIAYKSVRLANNFCKKWVWIKDNKKIIADFVNILSRHRINEGFELVHT